MHLKGDKMQKKNQYYIHKNVKKKEMVFEYVLLGILGVLLIYLVIYAFNLFPSITAKVNIITVGSAIVASYALVWQLYSAIKAKRVVVSLGLDVAVNKHDVIISASLTNVGTKSIYPLLTNIYISEGIVEPQENVDIIKFEPVTDHNQGALGGQEPCFECLVCQQCKNDAEQARNRNINVVSPNFPPLQVIDGGVSPYKDTLRLAYNLRLLSFNSLIHIMPKETFTEEAVFKITKAGYYRVFMIYTDKEWKDCICRSSVFIIEQ